MDLAAILNPNSIDAFTHLLSGLSSADNEQREQCERVFESAKADGNGLAMQLVRVLRFNGGETRARETAAVLARRVFTADNGALFAALAQNTQDVVKSELLNALKEESEVKITRKVCDLICEVAAGLM